MARTVHTWTITKLLHVMINKKTNKKHLHKFKNPISLEVKHPTCFIMSKLMLIFESNGISAFIYSTSSAMQQTDQKKKKNTISVQRIWSQSVLFFSKRIKYNLLIFREQIKVHLKMLWFTQTKKNSRGQQESSLELPFIPECPSHA